MSGELIFTMVDPGLILGVIEIKVYIVGVEELREKKGDQIKCVFFFSSMGSEN